MRVDIAAAVRRHQLRHAHMVGITKRSLICGFAIDSARIASVARAVRVRIRPESVLTVRSTAGTELTVQCNPNHRWVEHVGVIRPGRWENLPSGELVTAPGDVRGVFVCNASMSEAFGARAGLLGTSPVRVSIEASYVRSVTCANAQLERDVRTWIRSADHLDRVGLAALGTNIGLVDPVGEILCDQNLPGLHLGFGATFSDETGAGWNASRQLVMAGAYGDVDLDGVPLIRAGRYLELS